MSHKRSVEDARRLRSLGIETKNAYGAGAYYDKNKKRWVRYTCNDKSERITAHRITRRKLKNNIEYLPQRGKYKRLYDYWWSIT